MLNKIIDSAKYTLFIFLVYLLSGCQEKGQVDICNCLPTKYDSNSNYYNENKEKCDSLINNQINASDWQAVIGKNKKLGDLFFSCEGKRPEIICEGFYRYDKAEKERTIELEIQSNGFGRFLFQEDEQEYQFTWRREGNKIFLRGYPILPSDWYTIGELTEEEITFENDYNFIRQ